MKFLFYDLGWRLLRPFLPLILGRRAKIGKEIKSRLGERFGHSGAAPVDTGAIWLHAVSVGESVAAISLVHALSAQMPAARFLITTNTVTAATLVDKERCTLGDGLITHRFQPLDHPDFVECFLTLHQPRAAIFMESDFWPNLITRTAARGVPVIFASAQLSTTAFHRWTARPGIARRVFSTPQLVFAVNEEQASQFRQLGTPADRISVIGSLKTGGTLRPDAPLCRTLKTAIGDRRVFVAASTHEGEDGHIIAATKHLGTGWLTIIAPRHPERGNGIALAADGAPQRSKDQFPAAEHAIFIMDRLGEMGSLFSLADMVFLGGSLVPRGGHNPLEPASFGLPIITGPHIFKNAAEFAGLRAAGVVFDLPAAKDTGTALADVVGRVANDDARRRTIAKAATDYAAAANDRSRTAAAKITALLHGQA